MVVVVVEEEEEEEEPAVLSDIGPEPLSLQPTAGSHTHTRTHTHSHTHTHTHTHTCKIYTCKELATVNTLLPSPMQHKHKCL